jgi:uncharacterized membrane protein YfcA
MTAASLVVASAVVAVASTLQGSVGFGLSLLAAPLLILIDPLLVPGPLLFASLVLTASTAYRDRRSIDRFGLKWGLVGRLPGTAIGAAALAAIPADQMGLALGGLVLLSVALSLSGLRLRLSRGTLLGAGALSGFMGTTASISGPPVALVYQHASGPRLRGTLAGYFVIGAVISLAALWGIGRFGPSELSRGLALVPGMALGFALSGRLVALADRGYTRPAVLAVSAASALAAIARDLL